MSEIQAFEVSIDESAVADLRARLERTRWPDQVPGTGWDLGTERSTLQRLCARWADGFDVDAFQRRCNTWPQIRTEIDGVTVHAIVARSEATDATPLMLLHGWPGSVAEYFDVIEPLRARHHVVVPSLPGYGFSGPIAKLGVGPSQIGGIMVTLMERLGWPTFTVAGGDWGSIIAGWMGAEHQDALRGLHLTMMISGPPEGVADPMSLATPEEVAGFTRGRATMATGAGYQAIQSTRPQSLAYALTDSPAGLAGWIVEKFHAWSDCHGDLANAFTDDRVLENVSIYWFTGTIGSSMRLYYEGMSRGGARAALAGTRIDVPTGHAVYPGELYQAPRAWAERQFNIVHWERMPRGGHFAAMEVPELYAADLLAFTAALGE